MSVWMRRLWSGLLGLGLIAALGCHAEKSSGIPAAAIEAGDMGTVEARQTVVALLDALGTGDCEAIASRLGDALRERMQRHSCADFLAQEPLAAVQVRRVGEAQVDGRDPRSFFVHVSLVESGHERPVMVRVQHTADGHRVVSM